MADAPLVAALGMRGSGKSSWVREYLRKRKRPRLAVWDLMREHQADIKTADLGEAIRAMAQARFSVAYYPDAADEKRRAVQFDLWCKAVYCAQRCTALVEEVAFVTSPMKAPPGWRQLSLLGRHKGCEVIATSQRPASIDKDFLGNCSLVHTGRLAYEPDAKKVAQTMGVTVEQIMSLPLLHWIERGEKDTKPRFGEVAPGGALGRVPKARNLNKKEGAQTVAATETTG